MAYISNECITDELLDDTYKKLCTYGELAPMLQIAPNWKGLQECFKYTKKPVRSEKMNKAIMEAFEKTVDAVLVHKHFGHEINNFTKELILIANKDAYLAEAKRREAEEIKRRG